MSQELIISFAAIAGTGAALGTTGRLSLVADRPAGVAGGTGLGFNGAELLALSIGGCFWNDLHVVAEAAGRRIAVDSLQVSVTLAGTPVRVVRARLTVRLSGAPEVELAAIFEETCTVSTIAASIAPAIPVHFERLEGA